MASEYNITSAEVAAVHVEAAPTILKDTPLVNKQVFDKYADLITSKYNGFVDYAEAAYVKSTAIVAQVGKQLFPIGSVLTNTTGASPSAYLGFGTWVELGNFEIIMKRSGQDNATVTIHYFERFE